QEMDGNDEPSSFMHQCEQNILNSISSLLVNPADSTSIPHFPPNDYELPSLGPDMSPHFTVPKTINFCTSGTRSFNFFASSKYYLFWNLIATMDAAVVGTNNNIVLHPTKSHLNKHQHVGNTKYSRRVQNAIVKPLVAERHRRERLNQHFIALSAQIPGLKKIDRASVLEEATKYLTQLKEKVKTLEEEQKSLKMSTNTKTTRSLNETTDVATMNKKMKCDYNKQAAENSKHSDDTSVNNDDDFGTSSCEGNYEDERLLPEIEARVSHNNIFIRIHCEKHQGVLGKVIKEIEKLHLTVLQSSVMPSGNSTLYITIISQVTIL
ncbi:hypothetical protein MKW92_044366, partial [Papaver armeniacum]